MYIYTTLNFIQYMYNIQTGVILTQMKGRYSTCNSFAPTLLTTICNFCIQETEFKVTDIICN